MRTSFVSKMWILAMFCLLLMVAGCTNEQLLRPLVEQGELFEEYPIGPGDTILIEFRRNAEFTRELRVGPDSKVNLPIVGEIPVHGHTAYSLSKLLTESYGRKLTNPDVIVTIVRYASKRVYVFGEVIEPIRLLMDSSMTVIDAISLAGGMTDRAQKNRVKLVRTDLDEPMVYTLDLHALISKGQGRYNLPLQDKDIIFVPPTFMSQVGYFVSDMLFPITSIFIGIEQSSSANFALRHWAGTGLDRAGR